MSPFPQHSHSARFLLAPSELGFTERALWVARCVSRKGQGGRGQSYQGWGLPAFRGSRGFPPPQGSLQGTLESRCHPQPLYLCPLPPAGSIGVR